MKSSTKRVTAPSIYSRKGSKQKISALTAYDYTMAKLLDAAGVDILLVGDSLGTVIQGHDTTLPVTLDEVIYHSRCVTRGVERALVVADLPFMSYQISIEKAVESACRLLKESGVSAVKLEGGEFISKTVKRLVEIDIPVMGHIGLTPQSYHRMGGNKIQGSTNDGVAGSRDQILRDAIALEHAGVFAMVIEGVPAELAADVTSMVSVPTIGIGAGPSCDGQILVTQDMLGMIPDFAPKFVKRYANLSQTIDQAVKSYIDEVSSSNFPGDEHSFVSKGPDLKLAKKVS
ncbi:MAG: 3-methyl-2-oxobutanoate hydroxymethyltransferase [Deltaproteobacteria bacterium]|nr:3-methyl-2-oxobutanoate hydroxymethyltransferase [Deltaproteobacteria bacterium]